MVIGLMELGIHIPYSHSLKEKRKTMNIIKDRIGKRYNVAFAELDHHDKWQRIKIGFVTLNNSKNLVEKMLNNIALDIEQVVEGEIFEKDIHFI
ncbi:MAG: DUF503 domain-containing protein [Acidobacteriota bacterium]